MIARHFTAAFRHGYRPHEIVKVDAGFKRTSDAVGRSRYREHIEVSESPDGRSVRLWWNGVEIERPAPPETKP